MLKKTALFSHDGFPNDAHALDDNFDVDDDDNDEVQGVDWV